MSNSVVIQLPSYNSIVNGVKKNPNINNISNGEWEVNLAQPLTVNQGDNITVKQAFLDTRQTNSGSIVIDEDTPISLEFYFYLMVPPDMYSEVPATNNQIIPSLYFNNYNSMATTFAIQQGSNNVFTYNLDPTTIYNTAISNENGTNQTLSFEIPMIAVTPTVAGTTTDFKTQSKLVTGKWNYTLKAGSYAYTELALVLTKAMSELKIIPSYDDPPRTINGIQSFNPFVYAGSNEICFADFLQDTPFRQFLFESGYCTKTTSDGNPVTLMPQFMAAGSGGASGPSSVSQSVGATAISLIYNSDSGKFEWEYMHTPLQNPASLVQQTQPPQDGGPPIESVILACSLNDGTSVVNICKYTRHSGIIFKKMEPISFWDGIMGFDVPNITVNDEMIYNMQIPSFKFNNISTQGYMGNNDMYDFSNPTFHPPNSDSYPYTKATTPASTTAGGSGVASDVNISQFMSLLRISNRSTTLIYYPFVFSSIATLPLQAKRSPVASIDQTGHTLIEILGYNGDFINDSNNFQIKAVVSNYYQTTGAFTSLVFEDSYRYVHIGESMQIQYLKCRIIDPFTMETLQGIGRNNCVYLIVDKSLSVVQQKQVTM